MSKLTIIAAIGKNYELGKDNKLLWHIPEDLSFFKKETINKPIIMGINTFRSLPKILPGRQHILLTHQNIELNPSITICHNTDELFEYLNILNKDAMIIGGASIYKQLIDYTDEMLLTEIEQEYEADVFFPKFDKSDWESEILSEHNYNGIKYKHVKYLRK